MEFRLLGPVEVLSGGQPLRVGGPRQRALLAYLVLREGGVVQASRLVEELWQDSPASGVSAVHTLVSRLRQVVGARIATVDTGYTIRFELGDEVDLLEFRARLALAGSTVDPVERAALLRAADALWRGGPLDGLDFPFVAAEAVALEELRLGAVEERIEAELEAGHAADLAAELSTLVARHPLRERLRRQWILALYRSGRQADALDAYRDTKRMFDEELGLELGPGLVELERAILQHDPTLAPPPRAQGRPAAPMRPRRGRRLLVAAVAAILAAAGSAAAVLLARHHGRTPMAAAQVVVRTTVSVHTVSEPAPAVVQRHRPARRHVPSTTSVHTAGGTVAERPAPPKATTTPAVVAHTTSAASRTTRAAVHVTTVAATKTTTTTTTKTPPPPPRAPVLIADSFGGATIDETIWTQFMDGTGWTMSAADGHLEFNFQPGTQPNSSDGTYGGHVGTNCSFPGDFDAQVDFTLVDWPSANGMSVILWAFFGPRTIGWTAQRNAIGNASYGSYVNGRWHNVGAVDFAGSLRVARRNGTFTAYYRSGGRWLALDSAPMRGTVTIGVGVLGGQARGVAFNGHPVVVDLDNFRVTASSPDCPGGTPPTPHA